ncbi:MAG: hypothetical protein RLN72_05630, partial [Henriciella sp.]
MSIQLSRGMTSLAVLSAGVAAASLTTFYFVGQARQAEAQQVMPVTLAVPLAATVFTTDDLLNEPLAELREGKLKSRETLVELVNDLGASPADASNALKAIYDAELIDPRRVLP